MKDKKGFTLIELLAVIVILAIIALIATPVIMNIINSSRENSANDSAKLIVKEAVLAYNSAYLANDAKPPTINQVEKKFKSDGVTLENHEARDGFGNICTFTTANKFIVTCINEKYVSISGVKSTGEMLLQEEKFNENYQRVEYIEATGTQYIDTNCDIYSTERFQINLEVALTSFYNYNTIFGSTYDSDTFEMWAYDNASGYYRYNNKYVGRTFTYALNKKYKINIIRDSSGNIFEYYDNQLYLETTIPTKLVNNSLLIWLSGSEYGKSKIYYFKIYKNNNLVRNLIPCYRISDSVIGMYDTVNDVFYTNKGSGNFIKGPNI